MPSLSSVFAAVDADILSQAAGKARRPIGKMISCSCLMFSHCVIMQLKLLIAKAVSSRLSVVGTNPYPQPCSALHAFDISVQRGAQPEIC